MKNEEDLLASLLYASSFLDEAPTAIRLAGEWYDVTIGIGKDHTARILIDGDSLRALYKDRAEDYKEVIL